MSESPLYNSLTFRDLWEILRLPVLLALVAIAGTWAVWYLTNTTCTTELAQATGCNPSRMASYINLDALNKMMTHAVIAGGGGGLWSYIMTTRQRKAIEHLAKQLSEERERAAEERERAAALLAEERERAAEERSRHLAIIEDLNQQLAEQRNGGNGQTP